VSTAIDTRDHTAWIVVKAGRKGDRINGNVSRDWVEPGAALGAATGAKFPEDLNFAIRGDLTIKAGGTAIVCRNVVLGQGHKVTLNNWWVGGPYMGTEIVNGRLMLVEHCEGGLMHTTVGGVGENNFDLYVSPYKATPRP
jgi:hypothetical protein